MRLIDTLRARRAARSTGAHPYRVRQMRHHPTHEISESADLQRVLSLPRQSDVTDLDKLVSQYTQTLRTDSGTMVLHGVQALALHTAAQEGGLFANIGVGRGKTLLSLLLPVVMKARKTALLIPPGLLEQLLHKNYPELKRHWRLPSVDVLDGGGGDADLVIIKHSQCSGQTTANFLDVVQPDLIVIDEAHAFAGESARGGRVFNWVAAHPSTKVAALSGTLIDSRLQGASRLANLTLREGSPYPRYRETVTEWAEVFDGTAPRGLGAMLQLANPGPYRSPLQAVKAGFRRRVLETPGVVVAAGTDNVNSSLVIRSRKVTVPASVRAAMKKLRDEWETPTGIELTDALEVARHMIELSQGLCYRWDWPNGVKDLEWLEARSKWSRAVRRRLQNPQPGLDTEGLLRKAAAAGKWRTDAYEPWAKVMNRPQPPTVADWVSDFLIQDSVVWGKSNVGVIWYEQSFVGPAVAAALNVPLYDGGETCAKEIIRESGKRTIVASRRSHGTGLELQMFNKAYFLCPVLPAKAWEQTLGRQHRHGQKASTVEVDVCLHTPELARSFQEARDEARLLKETSPGCESQKLLFADILV